MLVSPGAKLRTPLVLLKSPSAVAELLAEPLAVAKLTEADVAGAGERLIVNVALTVPVLPSNKLTSLILIAGTCTVVTSTAELLPK